MQCYIDFVRSRLIAKRDRIRNADYSDGLRVYYEDLWYLFRPGDLVFQQASAGDSLDLPYLGNSSSSISSIGTQLEKVVYTQPDSPSSNSQYALHSRRSRKGARQVSRVPPRPPRPLQKKPDLGEETRIITHCLDFNGDIYGARFHDEPRGPSRVRTMKLLPFWEIDFFHDKRDVTTLPVFPVRFIKDHDRVLSIFRKRGAMFKNIILQPRLTMSHSGWALHVGDKSNAWKINGIGQFPIDDGYYSDDHSGIKGRRGESSPGYVESEVIIDFQEAYREFPPWRPAFPPLKGSIAFTTTLSDTKLTFPDEGWSRGAGVVVDSRPTSDKSRENRRRIDPTGGQALEWIRAVKADKFLNPEGRKHAVTDRTWGLTDEDILLLPRRIAAYSFRQRVFIKADIGNLKATSRAENTFDNLQISLRHRHFIEATVQEHFAMKTAIQEASSQKAKIPELDFIPGKGKGLGKSIPHHLGRAIY